MAGLSRAGLIETVAGYNDAVREGRLSALSSTPSTRLANLTRSKLRRFLRSRSAPASPIRCAALRSTAMAVSSAPMARRSRPLCRRRRYGRARRWRRRYRVCRRADQGLHLRAARRRRRHSKPVNPSAASASNQEPHAAALGFGARSRRSRLLRGQPLGLGPAYGNTLDKRLVFPRRSGDCGLGQARRRSAAGIMSSSGPARQVASSPAACRR